MNLKLAKVLRGHAKNPGYPNERKYVAMKWNPTTWLCHPQTERAVYRALKKAARRLV